MLTNLSGNNNRGPHNLGELYRSVQLPIQEQLLRRTVKRFQGGLVARAHILLYHSTLGSRGMREEKTNLGGEKSRGPHDLAQAGRRT